MYSLQAKLLLLLLLTPTLMYGQVGGNGVPDPKMIPGSAVTNSGMESIYSPNLFEGTLNIGIPIYDYSSEDGSYGISISYNTKGVKVDEVSTPVSVHWNLTAEPSITRIVKDIPDECLQESFASIPIAGFGIQDTTNFNRYIRGKYITYMESPQQQAQENVYRDKEVDEFMLSFGGRTIKFNLGSDNYIFTHPHTNLKISLIADGVPLLGVPGQTLPSSIGSSHTPNVNISVRDEQGNVFLFEPGDTEGARYYSTDHLNQLLGTSAADPNYVLADVYYTQRWVLKKVTFSNGKEIKYFYNPRRSANYFKQYMASSVEEDWTVNPKDVSFMSFSMGPVATSDSFIQISRIEYPNGITAHFIYDPQEVTESNARLLKTVRISGSATECLNYNFNRTKINERWFLNNITLQSCDGQSNEPFYSFEYNPLQLPPRLNSGQDFYGYYNGDSIANHYDTLQHIWPAMEKMGIPQHYASPVLDLQYGVSREYNPTMAQAGILTKVSNGYGGEVSFRYKPAVAPGGLANAMNLPSFFPDIFLGKDVPDGVDIDSVIERDKYHPENSRVTKFTQSGGQLFMPGGYFHYPKLINSSTNAWEKVVFQNMFLTAHDLVNGSNHGYSLVEMETMTGSGAPLGRKVVKFSNMVDNGVSKYYKVPGSKDYFEYPYTDKQYLKSWELGLVLEIAEYDAGNRLVTKTINQYEPTPIDHAASAYISSTKVTRVNTGNGVPVPFNGPHPDWFYANKKVFTDTYYPFTGKALLAYTATQRYVAGNAFIYDTTRYAYDGRQNLSEITTRNSKGQIDKTIQVYNYSITDPQSQPTLANMNNSNIEKIVSIERWREGSGAYPDNIFSRKLLSSSISTFLYQNGFLRRKAVYTTKLDAPISYSDYTGILPNSPIVNPYAKIIAAFQGQALTNFEKLNEISVYDNDGNPLETQMNDQYATKATIWDQPTGNKLAEAINCHSNEIAYTGFETAATGNFEVLNPNQVVPANTIPGGGINGRYAYLITSNPLQSRILTANLTPGKEYYVTFWSNGGVPNFTGAGVSSTTFEAVAAKGSWTFYRGKFTPSNTGQIGFTASSNFYLDELRIFPVAAMMQTWTYLPLFGVSAATNSAGRITYYEYDAMGRLSVVRDQEDNILSKKDIVIDGYE